MELTGTTKAAANGQLLEVESGMIRLKCPKCKAELEISDYRQDPEDRTAVFCSNKDCVYHKSPLIGLDRKEPGVYVSEAVV